MDTIILAILTLYYPPLSHLEPFPSHSQLLRIYFFNYTVNLIGTTLISVACLHGCGTSTEASSIYQGPHP